MKHTFANIISRKSSSYKLLFFILIFAFISIGILVQHLYLTTLDKRVKKIQIEVEEQKAMHSIYQLLKNREQKDIKVLPLAGNGKFTRDQIESLPGNFRDIARRVNMDMLYISPDMNSIGPDSRYLLVKMGMRGDFFSFRKFLVNLGGLAFLERIEEIEIQENADVMEFRLKIRLTML